MDKSDAGIFQHPFKRNSLAMGEVSLGVIQTKRTGYSALSSDGKDEIKQPLALIHVIHVSKQFVHLRSRVEVEYSAGLKRSAAAVV